jgi:hypothetical protein
VKTLPPAKPPSCRFYRLRSAGHTACRHTTRRPAGPASTSVVPATNGHPRATVTTWVTTASTRRRDRGNAPGKCRFQVPFSCVLTLRPKRGNYHSYIHIHMRSGDTFPCMISPRVSRGNWEGDRHRRTTGLGGPTSCRAVPCRGSATLLCGTGSGTQ